MESVNEIIDYLKSISSEKYKANVTKLGIPEKQSLGVSILELRKLAKKMEPSNKLAARLWHTEIHEAKLLAVLITDIYTVNTEWVLSLMKDVYSWDLCDHLCKNLLFYLPEYNDLIIDWQGASKLYYKRAAYALIANSVLHNKDLTDQQVDNYLKIIETHETDSRVHVKKAVSWALREIGKKDTVSCEKAKKVAQKLSESMNANKRWVGKNALNELKKLVSVKERKRLLSANSKARKRNLKNKL